MLVFDAPLSYGLVPISNSFLWSWVHVSWLVYSRF